jgi:hypothetical protein
VEAPFEQLPNNSRVFADVASNPTVGMEWGWGVCGGGGDEWAHQLHPGEGRGDVGTHDSIVVTVLAALYCGSPVVALPCAYERTGKDEK